MPVASSNKTRVLLSFAAIYIIWGTTYLAVRIGITTISPFIMGAMRYLVAGTFFILYRISKKEKIFTNDVLRNILLGAVMQTGGQAMLFWAELYISSGFTAVLVATEPIWFIILDKPQWKYYFKNRLILFGIAAGFAGIIILFQNFLTTSTVEHGQFIQLIASLVTITSALFWTGGSLYFKHHRGTSSANLNIGWQLTGGVISCLIVSMVRGEWNSFNINTISVQSWLSVLYLAFAGSVIAFSCYNWLLTQKPAAIVGTYAYINPVIAVLAGSILLHEKILINQIIGMLVILVSAYLINSANLQVKIKN